MKPPKSFLRRSKLAFANPLKLLCGGSFAAVGAAVRGGVAKSLEALCGGWCGAGVGGPPIPPTHGAPLKSARLRNDVI